MTTLGCNSLYHIFDFELIHFGSVQLARRIPLDKIAQFFANAFWERMWIIQELGFSQRAVFIYGHQEINRDQLIDLLRALADTRYIGNPDASLQPFGASLHRPKMMLHTATHVHPYYSLDQLLRLYRAHGPYMDAFRATDPRDMVLALLNMSTDAGALGLVADYSATTEEIYFQTTTSLLRSGKLGVLSLAGLIMIVRYRRGFPIFRFLVLEVYQSFWNLTLLQVRRNRQFLFLHLMQ
jgi:hypothetical protein